MNKMTRYCFAILVAALLIPARADWTEEFVRFACVPDARYLRIDYVGVDGGSALSGAYDAPARAKRSKAWARQGFNSPVSLVKLCELPEATYRLEVTQDEYRERGMCAAAPSIHLSLFRDERPVVKNVFLGDRCFNVTNVKSIDLFDGHEGSQQRSLTMCVAAAGDDPPKCHSLSGSDVETAMPIDQDGLEKIRDLER